MSNSFYGLKIRELVRCICCYLSREAHTKPSNMMDQQSYQRSHEQELVPVKHGVILAKLYEGSFKLHGYGTHPGLLVSF